jgi:hypothetical protein
MEKEKERGGGREKREGKARGREAKGEWKK